MVEYNHGYSNSARNMCVSVYLCVVLSGYEWLHNGYIMARVCVCVCVVYISTLGQTTYMDMIRLHMADSYGGT